MIRIKNVVLGIFCTFTLMLLFVLAGCSAEEQQEGGSERLTEVCTAVQDETLIEFGPYLWRVLDEQDGMVLIITKDIIGMSPYHHDCDDWNLTWETSDVRQYLNGEFLHKFSSEEQERIVGTLVENPDNLWYPDTSSGGGRKRYR